MKTKLLKLIALSFSVILLIGCNGNKKNEPVDTENITNTEIKEEASKPQKHPVVEIEENIMNLIVEQKYKDAVDLMLKDGDMTNLNVSQVKQAAPFFVQLVKDTFSKNGGLQSFEIENPEVNADTKIINLVVNQTFSNDKTETHKTRYTLIKDEWKREVIVDNKKR